MKDDAELPAVVPRKRRQVEALLDRWIAIWLAGDEITPSERRLLEAEKLRRKKLHPDPIRLGVIVGREGLTPAQLEFARTHAQADGVVQIRAPFPVKLGAPPNTFAVLPDNRMVVRESDVVVAAPKEPEKPGRVEGVWECVRLAKQRGARVHVVLPNGMVMKDG